jgi:hypothetical protein
MKKQLPSTRRAALIAGILLVIGIPVWGDSDATAPVEDPSQGALLSAEILQLRLEALGSKHLGDITLDQAMSFADQVSLYQSQQRYINQMKTASFALPGLGHIVQGSILEGSMFMLGDLAITAGILFGVHVLLPASVQYPTVDYFNDSYSSIKAAWENLTFTSMLPAAGAMIVGNIGHWFYRRWASNRAQEIAENRIKSGEKTFTAQPLFEFKDGLFMGMSFHK